MGQVIDFVAFKKQAAQIKAINKLQLSETDKARVRVLKDKLIELEHILHNSPSVHAREKAVVDSIGVRDEILGLIT